MRGNEEIGRGIPELVKQVLNKPISYPVGAFPELADDKIAVIKILEGLARKASNGDAGAARELREWLVLEIQLKSL